MIPEEEPHTPQVRSTPSLCFTGDTSDMFLDIVLPGKTPNSRSPSCPDAQAASSSAADSALPDVKMPLMDELAVAAAAVGGSYPRISAVLHRFNILTRESEAPAPCSPPSLVKGPSVGPYVTIESTVLSDPVLARLASAMPKRFASTEWHLLYSTQAHGFSLGTLYKRVHERGAVVIAVRTTRGDVLGALLADGIRQPQPGQFFYGTGESFLFSVSSPEGESSAECGSSAESSARSIFEGDAGPQSGYAASGSLDAFDTESEGAEEAPPDGAGKTGRTDVRVYHWTGENFLFCFSSPSSISIGGGNGAAGLYLEDTLAHGSTGPTETFANPVLCPPQAGGGEPVECETQRFAIARLEVWGVDPSALRNASVGRAPEPPSMRRVTSSLTNMSQVMFDGFSEYTAWYTPGGR